mmetsp:Transcript_26276/g.40301  ORF Transcript_26276/g.40301 Transcript_26276/m.40301 type:complete len:445 (+) Transcript_26276:113-1447(+)|eukprot:CAMPEP_0195296734 /NCGR_PEP_ID=MMETSP0707-20130614/20060_1 /TAXON_ID=33640 /ORGANISM="Asterionellopsis glacialis, Strain CCMP134" /LENGTH=444 /DNA_ID=CAMNT_0040358331 /DNA_START=38 /DNA_END=1372 /DNA_ORIENTATION=+
MRNLITTFLLLLLDASTRANAFVVASPKASSSRLVTKRCASIESYSPSKDSRQAASSSITDIDIGLRKSSSLSSTTSLVDESYGDWKDPSNPEEQDSPIGIWAARALLLAVAMLWGTNFAAVKWLEMSDPTVHHLASEAAFARFGVAALVSIPLIFKQRTDVILGGMECGFWITFGYITQAMALQSIGAGECAFICSLTVVVVPLLSAVLFGKEIKPVHIVSAAIALSGVGILEGLIDVSSLTTAVTASSSSVVETATTVASTSSSSGWHGLGTGDLLALGQPFGFGLAFMRIEHYVEKFKDVENRVLTISAAQCMIVGLLSLVWVLYDFHGSLPNMEYMMEPHRLAAVGWTGIMTTVVAIYLEGVALQTASATEAALTFASEPVWASMFGAWLLHEQLDTNAYVGGAVILCACIMGALADLPGFSFLNLSSSTQASSTQEGTV